jgi:hypothetical protein
MRESGRGSLAACAALLVALAPAPARAAVYELASEWMTVSFNDGGKDMLLFTHLPDSDIFLHMKEYVTESSSDVTTVALPVPLLELVRAGPSAGSNAESARSLVLTSRATPYKMLVRLEREHQRYAIKRPPDFEAFDSSTSATLLSVFGVKTEHPNNFLVLVRPEEAAAPSAGLSDIEFAVVSSLDSSERTMLVGECGGEPGTPESLACWRGKISGLLTRHRAEGPSGLLSPFEQRYIQSRLSRKGYEKFQSLRSSAGDSGKLSLADDWHSTILDQDIAANAAAAAKASVPAAKPAAPEAKPAVKKAAASAAPPAPKSRAPAAAVPAASATVRAVPPEPPSARVGWKAALAVALVLAAAAAVLVLR